MRRVILAAFLAFAFTPACAVHRLDVAKAHYMKGLQFIGLQDRAAAVFEFKLARAEAQKSGDAQALLLRGQSEIELSLFEEARLSFIAARLAGAGDTADWESAALLLGLADVYAEMEMPFEASALCEAAMTDAKKAGPRLFEAAAARFVDVTLGAASTVEDPKARAKAITDIEKKARGLVQDSPGSAVLRYLLAQVELHLERYEDAWRQAVVAREMGLPDEEFLRDNDNAIIFCYRQLIEAGKSEYQERQRAWSERWDWPEIDKPEWMAE